MTKMVAERVPSGRVLAVDVSAEMLKFGIEHGSLSIPQVEVLNADLLELKIDREVDGVFSNAVFHWILDQHRLFSSLFRCLRPHGWLASQAGGGPNLRTLLIDVFDLMQRGPYAEFFGSWVEPWVFLREDAMLRILTEAGFVSSEVWLESKPTQFESPEQYRAYLKEIVLRPYLAVLSPAMQDSFLAELTHRSLMKAHPLEIDYHRLNIFARKP